MLTFEDIKIGEFFFDPYSNIQYQKKDEHNAIEVSSGDIVEFMDSEKVDMAN